MEARVKKEERWNTIKAFSGHEFNKAEWRPVPPGFEGEAADNPYLEVRGAAVASAAERPAEKPAAAKPKGKAEKPAAAKPKGKAEKPAAASEGKE